jgi:uncharacterized membrane protein required for colicin V production
MNLIAGFNWLDFLIFFVLIVSMGVGYATGLLRQMIALAALYIGSILGAQYYTVVTAWINRLALRTSSNHFEDAFAFFVILIFVTSIINWLAFDAYRSTRIRLVPLVDQLGGVILSLITTAITLSLVLPVIAFAASEPWPWSEPTRQFILAGFQTSYILPLFGQIKPMLLGALRPWMPTALPSLFFSG